MFSLNRIRTTVLLLSLIAVAQNVRGQNVEVLFTGLESPRGQILLRVFVDDKTFQDDKPSKIIKIKKKDVVNGSMTEKISLEPGTYGFGLVDDVNTNGTMDFNMVGMPKEGFGFSNYYLSGLKKPKFDQFKFTVNNNQQVKVVVKMRYM